MLLVIPLSISVYLILRPGLRPDKLLILGFAALGLALALGGSERLVTLVAAQFPLALAILLLFPTIVISRGFGRVDMVALLFHRDFGTEGATLHDLKNEIAAAIALSLLLWVSTALLAGQLGTSPWTYLAATALLLGINPVLRVGAIHLWRGPVVSVLQERLASPALLPQAGNDPDLVIVYLEGTDRRFGDCDLFGRITERLDRWADQGIRFTRIGQILGTGWSLAGMVASQAGVPVPPRGLRARDAKLRSRCFMPGITFLGDVLAGRGYRSHFFVGGDARFGGIGKMYESHGIPEITGLHEMARMFPPEEIAAASNGWVVDDQMVLEAARRVHRGLAVQPEPIALIIETFGPHGPTGLISRCHSVTGQAEETRDLGRAVACMIDEVLDFLDDLRAVQDARGRALRVVLLSDHLNHTPRLPKGSVEHAGYNTLIFWGGSAHRGERIDRPGAMVDVFPTLLDWLGWAQAPVAAGIGRSLFSETPTLVEEFGLLQVDEMLASDAGFSKTVWGTDHEDAC